MENVNNVLLLAAGLTLSILKSKMTIGWLSPPYFKKYFLGSQRIDGKTSFFLCITQVHCHLVMYFDQKTQIMAFGFGMCRISTPLLLEIQFLHR